MSGSVVQPPLYEAVQQSADMLGAMAPEYSAQLIRRHNQAAAIHQVLDVLSSPTIPIETAVAHGDIDDRAATAMYTAFTEILDNPDYARLVLYMPFQLLPHGAWRPDNPDLYDSVTRFKSSYLAAWESLLYTHDVRANFVDGDVIEKQYRQADLPRVVKAAHLIPGLMERGLYSRHQAEWLHQTTSDPVLAQSIYEALDGTFDEAVNYPVPPEAMTDARQAWLARVEQRAAQAQAADHIARTIIATQGAQGVEAEHNENDDTFIEGLYRAIETVARVDQAEATKLYESQEAHIQELWQCTENRASLGQMFRKLYRLQVIDKTVLDAHDISLPTLAGPHGDNMQLLSLLLRLQA